ncbi:MAG: DUF4175 domain-containing protein [Planctomycetota bacterium]|nr:DUF4175 domain-containing protein [Planctomycetota bacterium]
MPTVTQKPPAKPALSGKAQDAWTNIEGRVEDVRRRHRMKFATTGLLLGLAVFAAAFLGFSLVDVLFKLSVGSRLFWLALALGGTVAVVIWSVVRPWRMLGGSTRVAREVETAYPELEDQLSTALEYGRDGGLAQATSSPELVGALLEQAQRRAKPLDFRRTVNWRAVSWALLVAFVVAAVVATYGASNPRLFGATVRRFLMPTASIPAPTLTVIEQLTPGGGEYPVETSVPVTAKLSGRLPESATLLVKFGIDPEAPWEHRLMERGEDGDYHVTLRRLLDDATFQVKAGDALSEPVTLKVYQEPQVDEFSLRLEHPAYTGKAPEVLPAGMGEVRALKGTRVTVRLLANTELGRADLAFDGGRKLVDVELQGRGAELTFEVAGDDRYQLLIEDTRGRVNRSPVSYRIQATEDQRPRVRIKKPARDMMVHREQAVEIEIEASDDVGLREIGIFHSLGVKEEKKMVRRFEPCPPQAMGRLKWELGNLGLKGGEVLAYYAYALDNDTLNGPKLAKSDIHFLTVYDEEEYDAPQDPQNQNQPTPESVRQLDKLIEIQKKLLQETFAMARLRNEAGEDPKARQEDAEAAAKRAEREKKRRRTGRAVPERPQDQGRGADPAGHPGNGSGRPGREARGRRARAAPAAARREGTRAYEGRRGEDGNGRRRAGRATAPSRPCRPRWKRCGISPRPAACSSPTRKATRASRWR